MGPISLPKTKLGNTRLAVTKICFGSSGLGDMPATYGYAVDDERAKATVRAIFDGPVNFLDTARLYGFGRSEQRIGDVIRERGGLPKGFVLSTKLDRDPQTNLFDASQARRSLEQSLKALGVDKVGLLHLHDPEHSPSHQRNRRPQRRDRRIVPHEGRGIRGGCWACRGRRRRHDSDAAGFSLRRAHHPQPLHAGQPKCRGDDRSRRNAQNRRLERRALRWRRARQGVGRLHAATSTRRRRPKC